MKINVTEGNSTIPKKIAIDEALTAALQSTDRYCIESNCFQTLLSLQEVSQYFHDAKNVGEFRQRLHQITDLSAHDYYFSGTLILGDNIRGYLTRLLGDEKHPHFRDLYQQVQNSAVEVDAHMTLETTTEEESAPLLNTQELESIAHDLSSSVSDTSYTASVNLAKSAKNSYDNFSVIVIDALLVGLNSQDAATINNCAVALRRVIQNGAPTLNLITPEVLAELSLLVASPDTATAKEATNAVKAAIDKYPQFITEDCVAIWLQQTQASTAVSSAEAYASIIDTALYAKRKKIPLPFEPKKEMADVLLMQVLNPDLSNHKSANALSHTIMSSDTNFLSADQMQSIAIGLTSDNKIVADSCCDVLTTLCEKFAKSFDVALCKIIIQALNSEDDTVFAKAVYCLSLVDVTALKRKHVHRLLNIADQQKNEVSFAAAAESLCKVHEMSGALLITPTDIENIGHILMTSHLRNNYGHRQLNDLLDVMTTSNSLELRNQAKISQAEVRQADVVFFSQIQEKLKNLSLKNPQGQDVNVSQFIDFTAADHTIVVFWGTWCQPCKNEIPYLNDLKAQMPNVQIKAFANDAVEDLSDDALSDLEFKPEYSFLADPDSESGPSTLGTLMGVSAYPTVYVFDRNGTYIGSLDENVIPLKKGDVVKQNPVLDALKQMIQ